MFTPHLTYALAKVSITPSFSIMSFLLHVEEEVRQVCLLVSHLSSKTYNFFHRHRNKDTSRDIFRSPFRTCVLRMSMIRERLSGHIHSTYHSHFDETHVRNSFTSSTKTSSSRDAKTLENSSINVLLHEHCLKIRDRS